MKANWATLPTLGPKRFSTTEHNQRTQAEKAKRQEDAERWFRERFGKLNAADGAQNLEADPNGQQPAGKSQEKRPGSHDAGTGELPQPLEHGHRLKSKRPGIKRGHAA